MERRSKWEKSRGATKGEREGWGGGGGKAASACERGCDVGPFPCEARRDFPFKSEPARGGVGLIIVAEGQKGAGSSHSITVIVQVNQIKI